MGVSLQIRCKLLAALVTVGCSEHKDKMSVALSV